MNWYTKITQDLTVLPDFISHYENKLVQARSEVRVVGIVEKNISQLPAITECHFSDLQTVEAVLNFLNIQLRQMRSKAFKKYLEAYNRQLTSRDAEKYVDGDSDIIDMETFINSVALIRNKYLGIMKGLESKGFQLTNIVKLRVAGMEDITL